MVSQFIGCLESASGSPIAQTDRSGRGRLCGNTPNPEGDAAWNRHGFSLDRVIWYAAPGPCRACRVTVAPHAVAMSAFVPLDTESLMDFSLPPEVLALRDR